MARITVNHFRTMLEEYDAEVRPLRDAADAGRAGYEAYDEAYNCWLEELHTAVTQYVDQEDK